MTPGLELEAERRTPLHTAGLAFGISIPMMQPTDLMGQQAATGGCQPGSLPLPLELELTAAFLGQQLYPLVRPTGR